MSISPTSTPLPSSVKDSVKKPDSSQVAILKNELLQLREEFESREIEYRQRVEKLELAQDEILQKLQSVTIDRDTLAGETEKLRVENHVLKRERDTDIGTAAKELNTVMKRLNMTENRLSMLRRYELELKEAVEEAKRSYLSRKELYCESEDFRLWPETEQWICGEVIERLELLDSVLSQVRKSKFYGKIAQSLELVKEAFLDLLREHNIEPFELKTGAKIPEAMRGRIFVIDSTEAPPGGLRFITATGEKGTVRRNLRPGYIYKSECEEVILQKAEVELF